jgi:arylsulfate sulfotransferase
VQSINGKAFAAFFFIQTIWAGGCSSGAMQSNAAPNTPPPATAAPLAPAPAALVSVVSATENPQVARYTIVTSQYAGVTIDFGLDTNYGLQTWTQYAYGGFQTSVLVAGMRAFTTYHMRARLDFADGSQLLDSDHTFVTGGLPPSRVPQVTVTQPGSLAPNPGIELFDIVQFGGIPLNARVTAAAFDLQGNLIWFKDLPDGNQLDYPFPIKLLPNGNFLLVVGGQSNSVREINLAGETVSEFSLADLDQGLVKAGSQSTLSSFHHDILPLPNGHLILLASQNKTFTDLPGFPGATQVIGDALVDLNENREPVWIWSTFDHLDLSRQPLGFPDWTHANAVIYSPDDGNLILSMRNQNWVIKINYKDGSGDGTVLWRLGPGGDFTIAGGTSADFNYAQHYPVLVGPKRSGIFPLLLFDNGNNRIINGGVCNTPGAASCYSRPVLFQLDETAKTAQILWQYKLPVLSGCCGNINILDNGNIEYDMALFSQAPLTSRIQEVTMDPTNPQLVWQADLSGQLAYRALRIPSLYPGVQWK